MSKTQEKNTSKLLTRAEILNVREKPKTCTLPSGVSVRLHFIPYVLIHEIYAQVDGDASSGKERLFAEKVVRFMLRGNRRQELASFSEEDQKRLIEMAAEQWGCEKEYNGLAEIVLPEQRFYQASRNQHQELIRQLGQTVSHLTEGLSSSLWMEPLMSSVKGLLDQRAGALQESLQGIGSLVVDQFKDVVGLYSPITNLIRDINDAAKVSIASVYETALFGDIQKSLVPYETMMKDVLSLERFAVLPDTIRYYPTVEMHNTSVVVEKLLLDEQSSEQEVISPQDAGDLIDWLGMLDSSFPALLEGAHGAIYSKNPDRCRHFASSHRELCTLLLHALAPDGAVRKWTTDPNHFQNGNPTRKARLLYIARRAQNTPFKEFFTQNFLNQMQLLNADEHQKNQDYTEEQLILLHKNFISTLHFLKEFMKGNSDRVE